MLEIVGIASIGLVVRVDQSWWPTVSCLFVHGLGEGLATAQLTGVVLLDVPPAQSGQGSGTQSTSRQIGSALGIAVLGTVLFTSLGTLLSNRIEGIPGVPAAQRDRLVSAVVDSAGAAISGLERSPATAAIASAARLAFTDAVRWAAFSAVVFLVLGFLTSLSLGRRGGRHASGGHKEPQPDAEDAPRVDR